MSTPEKTEAAGKKKEDGNALFKAGKNARAAKRYEKAVKYIEYDSSFGEEDVKLEYKTLKEKMKEYNQKKAKFYGNMFAKMNKLGSVESDKARAKEAEPEPMSIDGKA